MSKKSQILVVVESIDPNDSSGSKGRVALIINLVKAGHALTVLHYTQKDLKIAGTNSIAIKERKWTRHYFLSRIQRYLYRWFKINLSDLQEKRNGFSFTWINDTASLSKAIKKYNPEDFDMIWTLSRGTSFRPHHAVLKNPQWHSRWYAYVHDPYPQHLYPRPYNYVQHGYKKKRYFFMDVTRCARRVVFPSSLLKEWMQSYYEDIKDKSLIIPHQLLVTKKLPVKELPDYFDKDKFTILHAGNLLNLRNPKPLLEAYQLFLKKHPEATTDSTLLFIGKASRFDEHIQEISTCIPSVYNSKGYIDFNSANALQNQATINVILEAQSEISPFLPGKFTHCVNANKPILLIGPHYSESKRLLGEEYALSFDFNEVEAMGQALSHLYKRWKNKETLSLNRKDLEEYISVAHLQKMLTL